MFDTSARSKGFARKKVNNPAFDAGKVFCIRRKPRVKRGVPFGDISRYAKRIAEGPMREPQCFSTWRLTAGDLSPNLRFGGKPHAKRVGALLDLVDEPA